MKKHLLTFLFIFIGILTFGQSSQQDVVHLKNGSIIRGTIIEQVPNVSIKIETRDKSVFVYQMDEIEKFTKETVDEKPKIFQSSSDFQPGPFGMVELGYQIGSGDYSLDRLKLNIIYAYQFNPYFSVGGGTGIRYYFDGDGVLIPFFAEIKGTFLDNDVSPYLALDLGYSFDASDSFTGFGFLFSISGGVSFNAGDNLKMHAGLGYEAQKFKYSYSYGPYYSDSGSGNLGAISLNVGLTF